MASVVRTSGPQITGYICSVAIADIAEQDRLRPIDPAWAEALSALINVEGQLTPIEIRPANGDSAAPYVLVAGGHRMEAHRLLGRLLIRAIILDPETSAIDARMREVSENLFKRDLGPIDRAAHVSELHQLLRARDGVSVDTSAASVAANARWQKLLGEDAGDAQDKMSRAYGWTEEIGQTLGLTARTIKRDLLLHKRLLPTVSRQLQGLPVASNASQLRALAMLDDAEQRQVAQLLVDGIARDVGGALAILRQRPTKSPEMKRLSAFIGSFQRMSQRERAGALDELYTTFRGDFSRLQARLEMSGDGDE